MNSLGRSSPASRRRGVRGRRSEAEIEVAIRMVASGAARSIRLVGLPSAARLAARTTAHARRYGVRCAVERPATGSVVLRFEPDSAG